MLHAGESPTASPDAVRRELLEAVLGPGWGSWPDPPGDRFCGPTDPVDLRGWGSEDPQHGRLLREVAGRRDPGDPGPLLVLELGSWTGAWAVNLLREKSGRGAGPVVERPMIVVCVDTWLGSLEMVGSAHPNHDLRRERGLQVGFPTVYRQWVANVVGTGWSRAVVPFPATTRTALQFFQRRGTTFDLVYVDASHEAEDVLDDALGALRVRREGGIVYGDDYSPEHWPGVVRAVEALRAGWHPDAVEVEDARWVCRRPRVLV